MTRAGAFGLLAIFLALLVLVAARSSNGAEPSPPEVIQGRDIERWRQIALERDRTARKQARTIRRLRKALRRDVSVVEAINVAAVTYGVSGSVLFRKAACESHLNPRARNRSSNASGLFQFLPSTWRSTPYGRLSVWSPVANALAAGWMHRVGRGGEWVCE